MEDEFLQRNSSRFPEKYIFKIKSRSDKYNETR